MAINLGQSTSSIVIRSQMSTSQLVRIDEQVRNIVASIKRTWPGTRAFGMDGDATDSRLPASIGIFAVELQDAVDDWIPNLSIQSVKQSYDTNGLAMYEIQVGWV